MNWDGCTRNSYYEDFCSKVLKQIMKVWKFSLKM